METSSARTVQHNAFGPFRAPGNQPFFSFLLLPWSQTVSSDARTDSDASRNALEDFRIAHN